MHHVGILVKKDKIPLVDSKGQKAKTPALLGSDLIRIAVNEFCETFGEDCLQLFECPRGISPLWFSTLCFYYYTHIHKKSGVGAFWVQSDDPTMIPVKTKTETVATINHQNPSAVKNNVKTATKLSWEKIQVKAKTPKPEQENNAIKS